MSELDFGVVGQVIKPPAFEYTWKDVVLYALGIGAQADELSYVYENASGGLKVLPTFGLMCDCLAHFNVPKPLDHARFIHAEHFIRLHRPLPPEGRIVREGVVPHIYDKKKYALIVSQTSGYSEKGDLLVESVGSIFYRGAGGFGGDPAPKSEPLTPPADVAPDFSVTYPIPLNQAALYRLNGDYNPLHIDPEVGEKAGFGRPILHGLCTYGYAVRAIVMSLCEGEVSRFKEFKARFTDVVYPGESITIEGWKGQDDRYIIQVCSSRGAVVLGNSYALVV